MILVGLDRIRHLLANPDNRIERVHGTLRDVGNLAEPGLEHGLVRDGYQVCPIHDHLPTFNSPWRLDHSHHRQGHGAFPGPRFTHQSQFFTGVQNKAGAIQCTSATGIGVITYL